MSSTLNADEINALMSAIQDGRIGTSPEPVRHRQTVAAYDLTSQDRVIRGQMPTLDAIHEQVASAFANGVSGRTRLPLRGTASAATLLKFSDFSTMLAPPATVVMLALGKGMGQALLVLEPGLADTLLAAALGDRKGAQPDPVRQDPRRELTSVERHVLKRLLTVFTDALGNAWAPVLPFEPEVIRFESDPRLAAIAPNNETAVLCSFELTGAFEGRMQLGLPWSAVEPARKLLSSPPRVDPSGDQRFVSALGDELCQVEVELRALLGETVLDIGGVLDLEVGHVLTLDVTEDDDLPVLVQDRPKLFGQPRVEGGNMALVVRSGPHAPHSA